MESRAWTTLETVGDDSWEEVVTGADCPVIVFIYAKWCVPCRMGRPMLEGVSPKLAGQVKIVACDIDGSPEIAERLKIRLIPTYYFTKEGHDPGFHVGSLGSEEALVVEARKHGLDLALPQEGRE